MTGANNKFDAGKITSTIKEAGGDQISRFEALFIYLWEGIKNAIEKHNANEVEMGFPPASHYEMSVSLSWALGWNLSA
jgi:hypothetical protein